MENTRRLPQPGSSRNLTDGPSMGMVFPFKGHTVEPVLGIGPGLDDHASREWKGLVFTRVRVTVSPVSFSTRAATSRGRPERRRSGSK